MVCCNVFFLNLKNLFSDLPDPNYVKSHLVQYKPEMSGYTSRAYRLLCSLTEPPFRRSRCTWPTCTRSSTPRYSWCSTAACGPPPWTCAAAAASVWAAGWPPSARRTATSHPRTTCCCRPRRP